MFYHSLNLDDSHPLCHPISLDILMIRWITTCRIMSSNSCMKQSFEELFSSRRIHWKRKTQLVHIFFTGVNIMKSPNVLFLPLTSKYRLFIDPHCNCHCFCLFSIITKAMNLRKLSVWSSSGIMITWLTTTLAPQVLVNAAFSLFPRSSPEMFG